MVAKLLVIACEFRQILVLILLLLLSVRAVEIFANGINQHQHYLGLKIQISG